MNRRRRSLCFSIHDLVSSVIILLFNIALRATASIRLPQPVRLLLFLWHSQVSGYALLVFGVLYYVHNNSLCAHTPGSYCARVALACGFFFSKKTRCNTRRGLIPRPRYNIIVFCTPRQHTVLSYCYAGLRGRALDVSFECRERTVQ